MSASSSIKIVICNVCKRVKFVILNVSLHSLCNNGHGCRNKCIWKCVLRTCTVCVVPVRMCPLMSFPHTKSNNAHDKISKSKTNLGIISAGTCNHTVRNNFVNFFFWNRIPSCFLNMIHFVYYIISHIDNVHSYACGYRQGSRNMCTINIYPKHTQRATYA